VSSRADTLGGAQLQSAQRISPSFNTNRYPSEEGRAPGKESKQGIELVFPLKNPASKVRKYPW